ncbi:ATP-binding protein [Nocardioides caricicola]|uniref:ATP-binding protein n=1 Tax=Nocardioides caricicola TaxID=634770 RepID=A0ABW0MYB3_9ACTN
MTEGNDGRLDLSAPATPEMMGLVHAVLEQLWEAHDDVAATDRVRFEMAVIEILGNIVEHAYEIDSTDTGSRRFDVSVAATETELVASFGDNGLPMSIDLSDVAMPDELAESGRGLALAMAAVDDLSYERENGRNLWRLTCTRKG